MKRFSLGAAVLLMIAAWILPAAAQDVAALEERVKRLTGYIQDLQEENQNQKRQIETLVKEISSLREQMQSQPVRNSASQESVTELARQVQEIEKKREADRAFLEKEFERLAKLARTAVTPVSTPRTTPEASANLPKDALEHTISSGDTLLAIALAYSKETGRKITTDLILKANPGLKPERLIPGNKILIPLPEK